MSSILFNNQINELIETEGMPYVRIEDSGNIVGLDIRAPKIASLVKRVINNTATFKARLLEWVVANDGIQFISAARVMPPNIMDAIGQPPSVKYSFIKQSAEDYAAESAAYNNGHRPSVNMTSLPYAVGAVMSDSAIPLEYQKVKELFIPAMCRDAAGRMPFSGYGIDYDEFNSGWSFDGISYKRLMLAYLINSEQTYEDIVKLVAKNICDDNHGFINDFVILTHWIHKVTARVMMFYRVTKSDKLTLNFDPETSLALANKEISITARKGLRDSEGYAINCDQYKAGCRLEIDGRAATKKEILDNLTIHTSMIVGPGGFRRSTNGADDFLKDIFKTTYIVQ